MREYRWRLRMDWRTDEPKDGRLLRRREWMRMKDERRPVKNMDEERMWTDGLTDEQKDERLLRPWNGWGWRMNVEQWRTWIKKWDGWTDELKEERLLRSWEWMRMKDERGALKNMDEERRWMDGRTDERAKGRTLVEATVMDEDDSLLRRWMKNMDEDRLCG